MFAAETQISALAKFTSDLALLTRKNWIFSLFSLNVLQNGDEWL